MIDTTIAGESAAAALGYVPTFPIPRNRPARLITARVAAHQRARILREAAARIYGYHTHSGPLPPAFVLDAREAAARAAARQESIAAGEFVRPSPPFTRAGKAA